MALKRILFAGNLWPGSTVVPRLEGLQALGLDVTTLDTTAWAHSGSRPVDSLVQRLYLGPSVWAMNTRLLQAAMTARLDLIWIDKGNWVYPGTLRRLRQRTGFIVHYNTDDVFARGGYFWLHCLGVRHYDLCLTTNRWNVIEIPQRCGVKSMRTGMGYDQALDSLAGPKLGVELDAVLFIGHWERHTESYISALQENGVPVQVWGSNWRKAAAPALRAARPLPQADYVKTLRRAKIALCALSRRNRNESTGRSFEIPAAGTLMVAERTAEHDFIFGDGQGAALFSTEQELVDKARYFLCHDPERQAIAATGHARCQSLGLSWARHLQREWPLVERVLAGKTASFSSEDDEPFWPGFREGRPFSHATDRER